MLCQLFKRIRRNHTRFFDYSRIIGLRNQYFSELATTEEQELDNLLEKLSVAATLKPKLESEVVYRGTGQHYGVPQKWSLRADPGGAFRLDVSCNMFSYVMGFAGSFEDPMWQLDKFGIVKEVELQDYEVNLMRIGCMTSQWMGPGFIDMFEIKGPQISQEPETMGDTVLWIKLKNGRVPCKLIIDRQNNLLKSQTFYLSNQTAEVWDYEQWQLWEDTEYVFPRKISCKSSNIVFETKKVQKSATMYTPEELAMPPTAFRPTDTIFDKAKKVAVPVAFSRSSHTFVQPTINGKEVGYMLLDTGSQRNTIDPRVAEQLALKSFGKCRISSRYSSDETQFCTASNLSLGQMTIENPVFVQHQMNLPIDGAPGPVIGVLGHDFFRRCVCIIPCRPGAKPTGKILIIDPDIYEEPSFTDRHWLELLFINDLPHLAVMMMDSSTNQTKPAFVQYDSGGVGVDLIFTHSSVQKLGIKLMLKEGMLKGSWTGASGNQYKVRGGFLSGMQIASEWIPKLSLLVMADNALSLSLYSDAVLCGDMMRRLETVIDRKSTV
eukprot:TRINITY_DN9670_c0_g1_i3.p1 TRINITY_DN9670_c0_g1~~TRINITY_DN9670_c0_g1_i3.p1  ORF type:complete len:549 (+),score=46.59 TRINITY_DN9670_c0_g1_i3:81-1727(+)